MSAQVVKSKKKIILIDDVKKTIKKQLNAKHTKKKIIDVREEYMGDDKDAYAMHLATFDKHIKTNGYLHAIRNRINEGKLYINAIIYLYEKGFKFTDNEIQLLCNQLCCHKSNSIMTHRSTDTVNVIKEIFRIVCVHSNHESNRVNDLILCCHNEHYTKILCDSIDVNLFTRTQLYDIFVKTISHNHFIIIPLNMPISCGLFDTIITHMRCARFMYIDSTTSWGKKYNIAPKKIYSNALQNYTLDKLITYCSNIDDITSLNPINLINDIYDEILSRSDKETLVSVYIDNYIKKYKTTKYQDYDYVILNKLPFKEISKICKYMHQKEYYMFILSYIYIGDPNRYVKIRLENRKRIEGETDLSEYKILIELYINRYKDTSSAFSYNDLFLQEIGLKSRGYSIDNSAAAYATNAQHAMKYFDNVYFKLFEEYFISNNKIIKFTIGDLEGVYNNHNNHLIYYLQNKGIFPSIKCFEYACSNNNSLCLVDEMINNKIFPNDRCMVNAIVNKNNDMILILIQFGCLIDDKMIELIVSTKFILQCDLTMYNLEYNSKVYDLCCKYNIDMTKIINKFTFNKALLELHLLCVSTSWNKVETHALKYNLDFDQICFDNSCRNRAYDDVNAALCICYEKLLEHDTHSMCKFKITFKSLDIALRNKISTHSIIRVLKQIYILKSSI